MGTTQSQSLGSGLIECACGCGNKLPQRDRQGRPRRYILGHKHKVLTASYHFNNPMIECSCGCGEKFYLYDKKGRERRYIDGHHRRKIGNLEIVKQAIEQTGTPAGAERKIPLSQSAIRTLLKRNGIKYTTDLTKVGGSTAFGRKAELDAMQFLGDAIDATCNDPHKSPFDLIWRGFRLNVKASHIKKSRDSLRWSFKTEKQKQCDYFLCIGYSSNLEIENIFFIPSIIAPTSITIPISLNTKWTKYLIWGRKQVGVWRVE